MNFHKYSATGNDFIIFDGRNNLVLSPLQIQKLCNRRFGIGADGILVLENSSKSDFKMRIFNSDGTEVEMCGNGARAIIHFAHHVLKIKTDSHYYFQTMNSFYQGEVQGDVVKVKMTELYDVKKHYLSQYEKSLYLNTGVPHYVVEVKNILEYPVVSEGRKIRQNPIFTSGTNVDFFSYENGKCTLRTYERGVEDETYACGTGIVATAYALREFYNLTKEVMINVQGGEVVVEFNHDFSEVYLKGKVELVFNGTVSL